MFPQRFHEIVTKFHVCEAVTEIAKQEVQISFHGILWNIAEFVGLHCYCSPASGAKNFHFSVILRHTLNFAERKSTKPCKLWFSRFHGKLTELSSTKCHEASPGFPKLPKYKGGNYFKIHCTKKKKNPWPQSLRISDPHPQEKVHQSSALAQSTDLEDPTWAVAGRWPWYRFQVVPAAVSQCCGPRQLLLLPSGMQLLWAAS